MLSKHGSENPSLGQKQRNNKYQEFSLSIKAQPHFMVRSTVHIYSGHWSTLCVDGQLGALPEDVLSPFYHSQHLFVGFCNQHESLFFQRESDGALKSYWHTLKSHHHLGRETWAARFVNKQIVNNKAFVTAAAHCDLTSTLPALWLCTDLRPTLQRTHVWEPLTPHHWAANSHVNL